jgi:hypothetical protein
MTKKSSSSDGVFRHCFSYAQHNSALHSNLFLIKSIKGPIIFSSISLGNGTSLSNQFVREKQHKSQKRSQQRSQKLSMPNFSISSQNISSENNKIR